MMRRNEVAVFTDWNVMFIDWNEVPRDELAVSPDQLAVCDEVVRFPVIGLGA